MLRNTFSCATRSKHVLRKTSGPRRYATETRDSTAQSRMERFNRRLPKFLHRYTNALGNAPVTHITSFLILHELTAIIPLFGLAGYFHYTHWLPSWFAEGAFVLNGVERFGRYFKRKGWIRSDEAAEAVHEVQEIQQDSKEQGQREDESSQKAVELRKVDKAWNISEGGVRLVVEFATAYAITKALLVPRIMFSVWATPWFAKRTIAPMMGAFKKLMTRRQHGKMTSGSGTGAVERKVPPKT